VSGEPSIHGGGDGEGVDRSFHDNDSPVRMLGSWKWLVEVDGFVVEDCSRRVLILRPARVAPVPANQTGDLTIILPDGNQNALAVKVGDNAIWVAVGETGVDELLDGESLTQEPPRQGRTEGRCVAYLWSTGVVLERRDVDGAACEISDRSGMQRTGSADLPPGIDRRLDALRWSPVENRPFYVSTEESGRSRVNGLPNAGPSIPEWLAGVEDLDCPAPPDSFSFFHPLDDVPGAV
jgi:hypothetical protein